MAQQDTYLMLLKNEIFKFQAQKNRISVTDNFYIHLAS